MIQQKKPRHAPFVTTRIGIAFFVVALGVFACALVANGSPTGSRIGATMWVMAIACCSVGGLVTMNSLRTLSTIEKELLRRKHEQRQWQTVRPIVGTDPVSAGWNQLLEDASAQQDPVEGERVPATLDQEVVTLARAMRHLPVAWVITDASGIVRFLGPATANLLDLPESDSCLLYTSPSPRDRQKSRMPSSA